MGSKFCSESVGKYLCLGIMRIFEPVSREALQLLSTKHCYQLNRDRSVNNVSCVTIHYQAHHYLFRVSNWKDCLFRLDRYVCIFEQLIRLALGYWWPTYKLYGVFSVRTHDLFLMWKIIISRWFVTIRQTL